MDKARDSFDFHGLGQAIKQAREEKGWTQAQLAEKVGRVDKTISNIESQGQAPSFVAFFRIVTLLGISVDQFFFEDIPGDEGRRKRVDMLLSSLDDNELMVVEATAEALKKARQGTSE